MTPRPRMVYILRPQRELSYQSLIAMSSPTNAASTTRGESASTWWKSIQMKISESRICKGRRSRFLFMSGPKKVSLPWKKRTSRRRKKNKIQKQNGIMAKFIKKYWLKYFDPVHVHLFNLCLFENCSKTVFSLFKICLIFVQIYLPFHWKLFIFCLKTVQKVFFLWLWSTMKINIFVVVYALNVISRILEFRNSTVWFLFENCSKSVQM